MNSGNAKLSSYYTIILNTCSQTGGLNVRTSLSCYWELIFTKPSNWNNMLQTGWKNDLMTTTAMHSHQNVVEIVYSLYLSKRESRCRMPSQFGAGGSLWTEWHHGFEVCVHIKITNHNKRRRLGITSVPSHFICRYWNQALSRPLLDGGDKWHSCNGRYLCEGKFFVLG